MAFSDDLRQVWAWCFGSSLSRPCAGVSAQLTSGHYENFSVVTWLTPREHRAAFQSIYAFCRWSDDLGDEVGETRRSLELLSWWRGELRAMYAGETRHPVMIALSETVERVWHSHRAFRPADLGIRAGPDRQRIPYVRAVARLLHPVGESGRAPGPLRGRRGHAGKHPVGRRHMHGAPACEFLAGRGPRPRHRQDLLAP